MQMKREYINECWCGKITQSTAQRHKNYKAEVIRKKRVNWESLICIYNMGDNRKIRENMFRNNE